MYTVYGSCKYNIYTVFLYQYITIYTIISDSILWSPPNGDEAAVGGTTTRITSWYVVVLLPGLVVPVLLPSTRDIVLVCSSVV